MKSHIQHNVVIRLTNQEAQLLNETLDLLKIVQTEINNNLSYEVDYQDILEVFQEDGNPMVFYDNITE